MRGDIVDGLAPKPVDGFIELLRSLVKISTDEVPEHGNPMTVTGVDGARMVFDFAAATLELV